MITLPPDVGPAFAWAIALNAAYVVVEAGFGFVSGSLALLADAAHNLTDVAGQRCLRPQAQLIESKAVEPNPRLGK